jgi:hypothetical protein
MASRHFPHGQCVVWVLGLEWSHIWVALSEKQVVQSSAGNMSFENRDSLYIWPFQSIHLGRVSL